MSKLFTRPSTEHRPLELSPDDFVIIIARGVAHHINGHAEELREAGADDPKWNVFAGRITDVVRFKAQKKYGRHKLQPLENPRLPGQDLPAVIKQLLDGRGHLPAIEDGPAGAA